MQGKQLGNCNDVASKSEAQEQVQIAVQVINLVEQYMNEKE